MSRIVAELASRTSLCIFLLWIFTPLWLSESKTITTRWDVADVRAHAISCREIARLLSAKVDNNVASWWVLEFTLSTLYGNDSRSHSPRSQTFVEYYPRKNHSSLHCKVLFAGTYAKQPSPEVLEIWRTADVSILTNTDSRPFYDGCSYMLLWLTLLKKNSAWLKKPCFNIISYHIILERIFYISYMSPLFHLRPSWSRLALQAVCFDVDSTL